MRRRSRGSWNSVQRRAVQAFAMILAAAILAACGGSGPAATTGPGAARGTPGVASPVTSVLPLIATPTLAATPTASPPTASLRDVDWRAVLTGDPALDFGAAPSGFPDELGDLYLPDGPGGVYGFPALDEIRYGDLDGDGQEDAVIPFHSGGTAGAIGVLVYRATPDGPRLAAAQSAYKMEIRLDGGELVLRTAAYAGWEPNCCPSAWVETRYRLSGDALVPTAEQVEPVQGGELRTVEHFYGLLDAGDYAAAYTFLSPAFQAANPYDAWVAGFQNTERVIAYVAQSEPSRVTVNLEAHERDPAGDTRVRHFSGTWDLIFDTTRRQWLLDRAEIREVE
ncbi:hypothetical protein [Sphaerobacter sp.]|uniref:hypothetical protein n=1 Tax=Sphaerobacter sp. TaxID=2099654 RepID=UPI001D6F892F|nr:hypothetical protein [Sphaerobacter sp.]MBX5445217.1 hypothetical protein [Sphaerobacter sp.]